MRGRNYPQEIFCPQGSSLQWTEGVCAQALYSSGKYEGNLAKELRQMLQKAS